MSIRIYNTLSGRKEVLKPKIDGHVKMYVCGITAYDYCHIGHARSALAFDMIYRYLLFREYEVTYVRNFTDIDDKIINRAKEQQTSSEELAERFIHAFREDMDHLGVAAPTLEPKATEHVSEIIALIQELMDKGLAYRAAGDVFYSVDKFAHYGRLSGRNLDDMQAGARISVNESKANPMDFALWKSSKPGEPTWDSPWGPGRPGWHIECSAMSGKYLGSSFDIHGGGKDLIFPHHENEIAQSEGASGEPFVTTWVHHGFVNIKEEKMSKSLGNFLTIREVLEKFSAEALRLFVFSTHYRNPLDYSEAALQDAEVGLERLYSCLADLAQIREKGDDQRASQISKKDAKKISQLSERFQEAMDNDFNTAQALGHMFDAVKILNKISHGLSPMPAAGDVRLLKESAETLVRLGAVMGLLKELPRKFITERQNRLIEVLGINRQEVEELIKERAEARTKKDWAKSDLIRDRLQKMHIELKDGADGTSWKVKK